MTAMLISAAVLRAADAPYTIEQAKLRDPAPGEVLVRIAEAGLCHTDVLGRTDFVGKPVILGHEGSGTIESVGPGVTGLAPGDPVVLSNAASTPPESPPSSLPPSTASAPPVPAGSSASAKAASS